MSIRPINSSVLLTLGTLFALSNIGRVLSENSAIAEEIGPLTAATIDQTEEGSAHEQDVSSEPTKAGLLSTSQSREVGERCFTGAMAAAIAEDHWLFESEKEDLRNERLDLQAWHTKLDARMSELEALQALVDERWSLMQTTAQEDVQHLANMYGTMKPDQAALIFDQMDPNFAAGFLRKIKSEQAGYILANMSPDKAYLVSLSMASSNSDIRIDSGAL